MMHAITIVVVTLLVLAAIPAALFLTNLLFFRTPLLLPRHPEQPPLTSHPEQPLLVCHPEPQAKDLHLANLAAALPRITVLIPARDEAANIADCLHSVLAGRDITLDVIVLDDDSTDSTAAIVRELAARDSRLRLITGAPLPAGWNGKQHACWQLAQHATAPHILFLDADVRLTPDCIARCFATLSAQRVALLSGFPRLITITWLERQLLPLIHTVLLGYLPMAGLRYTTWPGFAAGCGQFMLVERAAYLAAGGHAAIRTTRHDGLRLPQIFRRHHLRTGLADITALASVRMYHSARAVWSGLSKNATEGIAAPARIVPFTVLLLGGHVLPALAALFWACIIASNILLGATFDDPQWAQRTTALILITLVLSYLPRLVAVARFRQPLLAALLHPIGVTLLLILEWSALFRQLIGRPVAWRDRSYSTASGSQT